MLLSLPLISLTNLIDLTLATNYFKHFVEYKYQKAGNRVIELNKKAQEEMEKASKELDL